VVKSALGSRASARCVDPSVGHDACEQGPTVTMLRITDVRETMPDGAAVWTLKLEGDIQGEWVNALRRARRAVRTAATGASIRLVLADVRVVDPAVKVLLTEMYRDGVGILATGSSAAAIRDEIVDGSSASPDPRSRR